MRWVRRLADGDDSQPSSDDILLDRFVQSQDQAAFEQILDKYAPMVLGVCRRQLRDPHLVDDAFQATFLVFVRKAKLVRSASRLGSWLHSVAYRVAIKVRQGAARRQERETVVEDLPGRDDEEKRRRDLREVLDEELLKLPEYYRQPLVLCYLEGKTNAQAAELLGCPEGTIYGRLNRGREKLRQRLARRGLAPTSAVLAALLASEAADASVPAALLQATLKASRETSSASSIHALADAVAGEMGRRRLALYALAVTGLLVGIVVAGAAVFHRPSEIFPRRLLAVRVDHHLFVAPIETGKSPGDMRLLVDRLGNALHIDAAQRQLLSEDSLTSGPVTKERLERALAGYLRAARPQDRIVLLLATHVVEIRGQVYLVPFEGNPLDTASLIPWNWLEARLGECAAQQKVVILDTCRVNTTRPSARATMRRLSKAALAELEDVPAGVQLWLACGAGEISSAGDFFAGSLFLEELEAAVTNNAVPAQQAADPLPVAELAEVVNKQIETRARAELGRRQTARLVGTMVDKQVPEVKLAPEPYRLPRDRGGDLPDALLQSAVLLDRVHRVLDTRVEEVRMIRRSNTIKPGLVVQDSEEISGAVRKVQTELAALHLEMREKLELLEGIESVNLEWAGACSYTRVHLMALMVRIFEWNYRLSDLRFDSMPDLDPQHEGWMLVSREQISARGNEGREARKLYDKSQRLLVMLEATHGPVPWRRLALRDGILQVGLVWEPYPLDRPN
ncbi:MAG: sigma-70 family RNA polymerase sigma factor [Gemmataceae bacterium]